MLKKPMTWLVSAVLVAGLVGGYYFLRRTYVSPGLKNLQKFLSDPEQYADWKIKSGARCGEAPFVFPTNGYIGFVWEDSFRPGHHHAGIDIFGGEEPGVTEVRAAYDGYLTRKADWKSTVIIRIPSDPLHPGRQIWTYYTHMADSEGNSFVDKAFPPGTNEVFVKAGTLLGRMGNFSGTPDNPTGVHLHFSVVKDDGKGMFLNELQIENTYDPSPYFGLPLNAKDGEVVLPIRCAAD